MITAQWFLTLFTYTFPVAPTVLLLWDYIFLTGWEGEWCVVCCVFLGCVDYSARYLLLPAIV